MVAAGWALLAASVALFATRYSRSPRQPLVVAATFAYGADHAGVSARIVRTRT